MFNVRRLLMYSAVLAGIAFTGCGYNSPFSPMGRGHMFGYGMYGTGGFGFMGILWIVLLLAIGFGIYYFIKNRPSASGPGESPLDILKKRYASGEITREEFEKMKDDMK